MGECITYFIDPSQFKNERKVKTIPWIHDHYFRELQDGELAAYILSIRFKKRTPATDRAKSIGQFAKMCKRPMTLNERAIITRALRETPVQGMKGNNFLAHAREVLAQKERERELRLQMISNEG